MNDGSTSENSDANAADAEVLKRERYELLQRLEDWLETPMLVLAFVWLALLVAELIRGESLLFYLLGTIIWVVFILDFAAELILAPDKVVYLKRNWLTAISLLIPALRIFRVFRAFRLLRLARTGRGLRLVRVVSSLNRGMKALGASLSRRGFGYVTAALATFFVGRDADSIDAELAGAKQLAVLRDEVIALRDEKSAPCRDNHRVCETYSRDIFVIKLSNGWASANGRHIWSNDPSRQRG